MPITTQINLLEKRRTKIIATLGPASSELKQIRKLIKAGVSVFRQNMSHGDHSYHQKTYALIREAADDLKRPIAILADLCGPKIRTGKFKKDGIELKTNDSVIVTTRNVEGEPGLIPSQYAKLADDVGPGDRILLADGTLELEVDKIDGTEITCTVVYGGKLSNYKGINLPGVEVSAPSLTEKDKADAKLVLELGVDFLALSFVRSASDILDLRELIKSNDSDASIIAKIEKPEALYDAHAILDAADGIMVARGDLGIELNPEQVPVAQHQLIDLAREKFKPVIVATHMLDSMIENPRPTRAEVTDVAHAVTLGTDAIMLSGETAVGAFPLDSVKMMDRIARQTESYLWTHHAYGAKVSANPSQTALPIWDAADGIMVARGDLGIELNPEQVPVAQHQLIDLAREKFKPVIVATHMLDSMIENPRPTRAEVTDVAHAVTLGTDAIMLSGETAVGAFPLDSVKMMDRIARQTESYLWTHHAYGAKVSAKPSQTALPIWDAVANSMAQLAQDLKVHAVVVISQSGMSAATMSSARPAAPVVAITSNPDVCRKMAMLWSVIPVYSEDVGKINPNDLARKVVLDEGLALRGEKVLLVRGFHSDNALNTPSVTVLTI